jgi:large subunit ribosomal protein L9
MKLIMLEDVDRLGKRGAVVNVANGYGRNFLIPRKLALPATDNNLKRVGMEGKRWEAKEAKEETDASVIKAQMEALSLSVAMKSGEGDVLFGSVTSANIAELLEKHGYSIDKRKIELDEPIKRLGEYHIPVKLHKSVTASVKLSVTKE